MESKIDLHFLLYWSVLPILDLGIRLCAMKKLPLRLTSTGMFQRKMLIKLCHRALCFNSFPEAAIIAQTVVASAARFHQYVVDWTFGNRKPLLFL